MVGELDGIMEWLSNAMHGKDIAFEVDGSTWLSSHTLLGQRLATQKQLIDPQIMNIRKCLERKFQKFECKKS